MSVENVKVKFIRPKGYQNLKIWMQDTKNVYIGRAGVIFVDNQRFPKIASPFCNPYKIGKHGTREEVLKKYRKYITDKLDTSPPLVKQLIKLKGKNLGCWCSPEPCHGNILLELIEIYS